MTEATEKPMSIVTIHGVQYAPIAKGGEQRHLVIIDNRGLTMVGMVDLSDSTYPKMIRNAQCVIRWGTTKHIAELAENGPQSNTKLGHVRDVTIYAPPIASYLCGSSWDE